MQLLSRPRELTSKCIRVGVCPSWNRSLGGVRKGFSEGHGGAPCPVQTLSPQPSSPHLTIIHPILTLFRPKSGLFAHQQGCSQAMLASTPATPSPGCPRPHFAVSCALAVHSAACAKLSTPQKPQAATSGLRQCLVRTKNKEQSSPTVLPDAFWAILKNSWSCELSRCHDEQRMGVERSPLKDAGLTTKHLGRRMCRLLPWLPTRREKLRQPRRHNSSLRGQSPSFVAASLARSFFASRSRERSFASAYGAWSDTSTEQFSVLLRLPTHSLWCGRAICRCKVTTLREFQRETPWGRCQRRRGSSHPLLFPPL
jgi:hypothetical protein